VSYCLSWVWKVGAYSPPSPAPAWSTPDQPDLTSLREIAPCALEVPPRRNFNCSDDGEWVNRAFMAARKAAPSLRYHDYLHAHKAGVLEKAGEAGDVTERGARLV